MIVQVHKGNLQSLILKDRYLADKKNKKHPSLAHFTCRIFHQSVRQGPVFSMSRPQLDHFPVHSMRRTFHWQEQEYHYLVKWDKRSTKCYRNFTMITEWPSSLPIQSWYSSFSCCFFSMHIASWMSKQQSWTILTSLSTNNIRTIVCRIYFLPNLIICPQHIE